MLIRLTALIAIFVATAAYSQRTMRPEVVPARQPLAGLPTELADWRNAADLPFENDIVAVLGVDEYLNRVYLRKDATPVGLYIGYYESQRQGDSIHSPLNCLPGAGWQPMTTARTAIDLRDGTAPVTVNRILIQKGLDRQLVLYWYQSHGRVVASEYASKAFLLLDAVRLNRSDAAMIRIISPVMSTESDDTAAAERATAFALELLPRLGEYLPS